MLNKHHRTESPAWKVVDIYAPSNVKTCWVLQVGESRFVPGGCDECERSDTLVDLNTRREDDGDCARCGAKGASIYFDGCRDSMTLLHFVTLALFGEAPETICCERCNRDLEPKYFVLDGCDVCTWCTSEEELQGLRSFVARMESGRIRGGTIAMFNEAERRIEELQAELELVRK